MTPLGAAAMAHCFEPGHADPHGGEAALPDAFRQRFGFFRREATLANWRQPPFSRWSFQNLREIAPTAAMCAGRGAAPAAPVLGRDALAEPMELGDAPMTGERFLLATGTDILLALKNGRPVLGWAAPHATFERPHLLFSVSKSLTALVVGALAAKRMLDLEMPVAVLLPEARGSAFGGATVRQLLDMRVSLDVDEVYGGEDGFGARYRRAVLWEPPGRHSPESHLSLLLSIRKGFEAHGGPFRYRSANSDLLGVLAERAGGKPFAQLAGELLWEPLGAAGEAYVSVDREGMAQTAGGMAVTAFDLAAVGEMMRQGGRVGSRSVLPEGFVRDTLENGDALAWKNGDFAQALPDGRYRNQWYATGFPSGAFYAAGIHGQWLYVVPYRAVTIVKLSSQAEPKSTRIEQQCLRFFEALAQRL